MAEVIAVVAIVSSIVQLVDFTSKIITRLNEFRSDAGDIPKSLSYLKAELPVLLHTLEQIHAAIKAGRIPQRSAVALLPVIQGCDQSIRDIESILDKTLPKQGEGRTKKALKAVGSVWKDGKIEGITKAIRDYIGTMTFYFAASSSMLQPQTDAKLVKFRRWLSAPHPSMNFEKALRLREPETGLWLSQSNFYKRWINKPSFVWLHGSPGCGKTVLSATVLENILEFTRDDPGKAVAYFYFDFNDQQKQNPELMIRSLVSQLSQQCTKMLPTLDALAASSENAQHQPSLDSMLKALKEMIEDFPSTYLILDALDECENNRELMKLIKTVYQWQEPGLHALFTSRREGIIKNTLEHILDDRNILCIQSAIVDRDIQNFVRQRLASDEDLQKWSSEDKKLVEMKLMERACGMFRLAACQLDMIRDCRNRKQLLQTIANLPPDLDEMYNRILEQIKENDVPYAIRILRWVTFSGSPLTPAEIAEVAALDADRCPVFDRDEVLQDPLDILQICPSLVTIVDSIVILTHYSVKEYLVSKRILQSKGKLYGMESSFCHRFIAKCCIRYLLQFDTLEGYILDRTDEFELYVHSSMYWVVHFKLIMEQDSEIFDLVYNFFTRAKEPYQNWVSVYYADRLFSVRPPSPLYTACSEGLLDIARRLVSRPDIDVNARGGYYGTALQVASKKGYLSIVQLLFENGADPNLRGGSYDNALRAASSEGHVDIVNILIEKGAEINMHGGGHSNALHAASEYGKLDVVKLLVEKGVEINVNDGENVEALQAASANGYLGIVQLLIKEGAEVNVQNRYYGNALRAASFKGNLDIVKLLIENGADVNANDGRDRYALHEASLRGWLSIVQLLIENGAEVNMQGGDCGHALQAASVSGNVDISKLLLKNGAEVNARGGYYGNALQAALVHDHTDTADFLIAQGAINTKDSQPSSTS